MPNLPGSRDPKARASVQPGPAPADLNTQRPGETTVMKTGGAVAGTPEPSVDLGLDAPKSQWVKINDISETSRKFGSTSMVEVFLERHGLAVRESMPTQDLGRMLLVEGDLKAHLEAGHFQVDAQGILSANWGPSEPQWAPGAVSAEMNRMGHVTLTDFFGRTQYLQVDHDIGLQVHAAEREFKGAWPEWQNQDGARLLMLKFLDRVHESDESVRDVKAVVYPSGRVEFCFETEEGPIDRNPGEFGIDRAEAESAARCLAGEAEATAVRETTPLSVDDLPAQDEFGGEWDGLRGNLTRDQRESLDEGYAVTFDDPGYFEPIAADGAAISNADGTEATLDGKPFVKARDYGLMPLEVLRAAKVMDKTLVMDSKTPEDMKFEWLAASKDEIRWEVLRDYFDGLGVRESGLEKELRPLSRGWFGTSENESWNLTKIGEFGRIWLHNAGPGAIDFKKGQKIEVLGGRWGKLIHPVNDNIHGLNLATALTMADALAERGVAKAMTPLVCETAAGKLECYSTFFGHDRAVFVFRGDVPKGDLLWVSDTNNLKGEELKGNPNLMLYRAGQYLASFKVEDVIADELRIARWTSVANDGIASRVDDDLTRWDGGYGKEKDGVPIGLATREHWLARTRELNALGIALMDHANREWRREIDEIPLIEKDRRYDATSINRHSIRTFEFDGQEFIMDRTTDGNPPFYQLMQLDPGTAMPRTIQVDGKDYWGDGLSWPQATRKLKETLRGLWAEE